MLARRHGSSGGSGTGAPWPRRATMSTRISIPSDLCVLLSVSPKGPLKLSIAMPRGMMAMMQSAISQ
jgi:hypothetical protein